MSKIIGISGKINSGKDVTAEIIQLIDYIDKHSRNWEFSSGYELYMQQSDSFKVKYFADSLRKVINVLTDIPEELLKKRYVKDMSAGYSWNFRTYRELLQLVGTEGLRSINEDVWCTSLFCRYDPSQRWLIPDTRFQNEAKIIKDNGGIVIRIERDSNQVSNHLSETDLDCYKFDKIISNNGTISKLIINISNMLKEINVVNIDIDNNHIQYIEKVLKTNEVHRGEISSIYKIPFN